MLTILRSDFGFSFLAVSHFLVNQSQEFAVISRQQNYLINFVCSHYLFAGKSMNISGRSCMLIISVSYIGLMEANHEYRKRLLKAFMYS